MDKKIFSVRRAAALVLALVMVLSTMTVKMCIRDRRTGEPPRRARRGRPYGEDSG